jgi:hypothetical protein
MSALPSMPVAPMIKTRIFLIMPFLCVQRLRAAHALGVEYVAILRMERQTWVLPIQTARTEGMVQF